MEINIVLSNSITIGSPFGIFLTYLFLFMIGASCGYVIEVLFRRFVSMKRWINPGFLKGPCLPLYGFGVCVLHFLCTIFFEFAVKNGTQPEYFNISLIENARVPNGNIPFWAVSILVFLVVGVAMTLVEFIAGIIFIRGLHIKLWDYSKLKGNIKGVICPLFSLIWALIGIAYWFALYPFINIIIDLFSEHLWGMTFIIGAYVGIFIIDFANSLKLSLSLNKEGKSKQMVIDYEKFKLNLKDKLPKEKKQSEISLAIENALEPMKLFVKKNTEKLKASFYIDGEVPEKNESETPRMMKERLEREGEEVSKENEEIDNSEEKVNEKEPA